MLTIKPNQSIGPVSLGMHRSDVARHLSGISSDCRNTLHRDVFAKGKVVIDYDTNDEVIAICINRDPFNPKLEPEIFGFNPLQQQAHKTIMRMSLKGSYDNEDPQLGMSYIYPNLGIYFWRDATPETLQKELQSQRAGGGDEYIWYQQALQDYQQFHCVGVFAPGYL